MRCPDSFRIPTLRQDGRLFETVRLSPPSIVGLINDEIQVDDSQPVEGRKLAQKSTQGSWH